MIDRDPCAKCPCVVRRSLCQGRPIEHRHGICRLADYHWQYLAQRECDAYTYDLVSHRMREDHLYGRRRGWKA